jgi:RHS repeat-associated protein
MTHLSSMMSKAVLLLAGVLLGAAAFAGDTVTYYHNDISGTPIVATDANGNVLWKENYQPYGGQLNNQTAGASNKLWFAGKPYDSNTGLTYMGARYYDPMTGRFMGVDPQGFKEGNIHSFNRYAYGNNNPYKYIDLDGHESSLISDVWQYNPWLAPVRMAVEAAGSGQYGASALYAGAAVLPLVGKSGASAAEGGAAKGIELTATQLKNVERFTQKLPANAKDSLSLKALPNEGVAAQATSPGRVPGSSAVYEKQIDSLGKTTQYTKTTYDPAGNIVHVKDKINGGVFP